MESLGRDGGRSERPGTVEAGGRRNEAEGEEVLCG